MAGAESLAPGDAIPVVDTAALAVLEVRRLHRRQMIRRGVVTALVVAIVGLLTAIAFPVFYQLRESWVVEAAGFSVAWQIDEETGGPAESRLCGYRQLRSWPPGRDEPDLRVLPRLLNVESLDLAECAVTEQGLAPLREAQPSPVPEPGEARPTSLRLTRDGRDDACLIPTQGMSQLQNLTLSGNRITDAGLALIAGLSDLESLDLDATDVTDAGLIHFRTLKKLKTLSLGGTFVTPQGTEGCSRPCRVSRSISTLARRLCNLNQSRREH